ncbi:MAG: alpha/beta hydrolase [Candidatus Promineifilaceae bacterium]|nr:alpha/beta hydrolase [Candidatus Promineifilaceae bacterium]
MNDIQEQTYRKGEKRLWKYYGTQPREIFLTLERPRVRVRVQEVGQGQPLLFVHGGPNGGTTWAPLVALMQDFRCLVLDRPGCGLSEAVDYGASGLRELACDILHSLLNALEIERLPVIASSMGGLWALWLAQALPQRVSHMVQLGCPALIDGMKLPAFMRMLSVPRLNRLLTRIMPASIDSARDLYRQIGHGASIEARKIPDIYFDWSYHLTVDTDTMHNDLNLIEKALTWRGTRPELLLDRNQLRRVRQPTLYIWGLDDTFGGADLARQTAEWMPDAQLHLIPEGGHLPWLDATEEVSAVAREFLRAPQAAKRESEVKVTLRQGE